jgi:hypothetical protein
VATGLRQPGLVWSFTIPCSTCSWGKNSLNAKASTQENTQEKYMHSDLFQYFEGKFILKKIKISEGTFLHMLKTKSWKHAMIFQTPPLALRFTAVMDWGYWLKYLPEDLECPLKKCPLHPSALKNTGHSRGQ